jgi:hypothetical protein
MLVLGIEEGEVPGVTRDEGSEDVEVPEGEVESSGIMDGGGTSAAGLGVHSSVSASRPASASVLASACSSSAAEQDGEGVESNGSATSSSGVVSGLDTIFLVVSRPKWMSSGTSAGKRSGPGRSRPLSSCARSISLTAREWAWLVPPLPVVAVRGVRQPDIMPVLHLPSAVAIGLAVKSQLPTLNLVG